MPSTGRRLREKKRSRSPPCRTGGARSLFESATIVRRRLPRSPAKGRRERTGAAEADIERHVGDRRLAIRQQGPGARNATIRVIAVRRNTERALEGAREVICAQLHKVRQCG